MNWKINFLENNKFFLLAEVIWSFSVILFILGAYNFLIVESFVITNYIITANDFITIVGLVGFVVTFWGFTKALQAASKSDSIEKNLLESHIILAEAKEDFRNIFEDHLLKRINSFRDNPGNICLLLSTPAYGYGVLGKESSIELFEAIAHLHGDSKIEIILFSQDAHFIYWVNLIFWSIVHEKDKQIEFLTDFGVQTVEMIDLLSNKNCLIWLKNDTTVRFFGYSSIIPKISGFSDTWAYVSLVDSISLYKSQYGAEFKVRSLPIHFNQTKDFFIGSSSYFHRIKSCPYTSRMNDEAALRFGGQGNQEHKELVDILKWDLVLGRTSRYFKQYAEYERFQFECNLFIKNLKTIYPKYYEVEADDIYKEITLNLLSYLMSLDNKLKIFNNVNDDQLIKIKDSLEVNFDGLTSIKTHFEVQISAYSGTCKTWQELLYKILMSGVGLSDYVKKIESLHNRN